MKNRFRCILKERVLKYHPFKVGQIINSVCILHNMCIRANIHFEGDEDGEEDDPNVADDLGRNVLALGQQRRAGIVQNYFME